MTNKAHSNNRNAGKKHGKIFFAFYDTMKSPFNNP